MPHEIVKEAKSKMQKSVEAFQQELSGIRTGRAQAALLDVVDVEAYGTKMKINQLANVTVPDAHLIVIDPWDKSQMSVIQKAIMQSPLGLTPSDDGKVIRVPIPQLTEERRKELVKVANKHREEAKIALRNVRRHAMEEIKSGQKNGDIPEDDAHHLSEEVEKITHEFTDEIDAHFKEKEDDIMEV
ncbi:MAG: ribosome recycling factor [Candidatus Hydrogenedentota bacterium]